MNTLSAHSPAIGFLIHKSYWGSNARGGMIRKCILCRIWKQTWRGRNNCWIGTCGYPNRRGPTNSISPRLRTKTRHVYTWKINVVMHKKCRHVKTCFKYIYCRFQSIQANSFQTQFFRFAWKLATRSAISASSRSAHGLNRDKTLVIEKSMKSMKIQGLP